MGYINLSGLPLQYNMKLDQ